MSEPDRRIVVPDDLAAMPVGELRVFLGEQHLADMHLLHNVANCPLCEVRRRPVDGEPAE